MILMTTIPTATPTLEETTARIKTRLEDGNRKLRAARKLVLEAAADFIAAGEELIVAKQIVDHGRWRDYLKTNFELSEDTAQAYMRVAKFAAKTETSRFFNFSQLLILSKLTADDAEKFIAAMSDTKKPAAEMTVRELRGAVKSWRQQSTQPTAAVTIDDGAAIITKQPASASVPMKAVQLSLFTDFPALPAPRSTTFELPRELLEAVERLNVPVVVAQRELHDFANPSIVIVNGVTAAWVLKLRSEADAFISPATIPEMVGGQLRLKKVTIAYFGAEIAAFARTFAPFGVVNVPYKQKSSAATNSNEALL